MFIPLVIILASLMPQECATAEGCRPDECAVSDVRGGLKCTPKTFAYMVWDAKCLSDVKVVEKTTLEAPMGQDGPDMTAAILTHVSARFKTACGHIELRSAK